MQEYSIVFCFLLTHGVVPVFHLPIYQCKYELVVLGVQSTLDVV